MPLLEKYQDYETSPANESLERIVRIAQKVFETIEQIYHDARKWELDTILQEQGYCYLYEKLGY